MLNRSSCQLSDKYLSGYSPADGTVEFYLRVRSVVDQLDNAMVLDLGAGRAAWYEDDLCVHRKSLRDLRLSGARVVAIDRDPIVLTNRASDEQYLIEEFHDACKGRLFDVIICDYVFEHIKDVNEFLLLVNNYLKSGGILCGRTPSRFSVVALFNLTLPKWAARNIVRIAQPERKQQDVFDAFYKLNTKREIMNAFNEYDDFSYYFNGDPAYYMGSKLIFYVQRFIFHLAPFLNRSIFVFLRKH